MPKQVLIQVISTQRDEEGSANRIEFTTEGTLHKREGIFYLIYREPKSIGIEGVTTSLKIEPSKVTLNRMGAIDQKQIFERGALRGSPYVTNQCSFFFKVLTKEIELDLTEQGGNITLKYSLFSDEHLVSHNLLRINIKEDAPQ